VLVQHKITAVPLTQHITEPMICKTKLTVDQRSDQMSLRAILTSTVVLL